MTLVYSEPICLTSIDNNQPDHTSSDLCCPNHQLHRMGYNITVSLILGQRVSIIYKQRGCHCLQQLFFWPINFRPLNRHTHRNIQGGKGYPFGYQQKVTNDSSVHLNKENCNDNCWIKPNIPDIELFL